MLERGVFGFLSLFASKGEIFVMPCSVIRRLFLFQLNQRQVYTVCLIDLFSLPLVYILVFESFFLLPLLLYDPPLVRKVTLC